MIIFANSLIIYQITGRMDVTTGFTIVSTLSGTLLYFIHERIWNNIHWGKQKG